MSYVCAPCQGANPVTVIVTSLKDGSTDQSCDQDLPIMLIGQLALTLQLDPSALYEHIKAFTDAADAADQAAAAEPDQAADERQQTDAANGHGDTEEGAAVDDSASLLEQLPDVGVIT